MTSLLVAEGESVDIDLIADIRRSREYLEECHKNGTAASTRWGEAQAAVGARKEELKGVETGSSQFRSMDDAVRYYSSYHFHKADVVEAVDAVEVAKGLLFMYYAGDCDHGADTVKCTAPGRCIATRKNSPDYFFIQKETP